MHLALRYPTVFGAVAAQAGLYDFNSEALRREALSTSFPKDWNEAEPARLVLSRLAATVPNPANPPFFLDWLCEVVNGETRINSVVWQQMASCDVLHDVEPYLDQPVRLNAIEIIHGRNEMDVHVSDARSLAEKMAELGIGHLYIEHEGGHDYILEESMRFFSQVWDGRRPQIQSVEASPQSILEGQSLQLQVAVVLDGPAPATGTYPALRMDLSALGLEAMQLQHDGTGRYTTTCPVTHVTNGWYLLPVVMETEGISLLTVPLPVFPTGDLVVLEDALASTWQAESDGGAESLVMIDSGPVYEGKKAAALTVASSSFLGWTIDLRPAVSPGSFGYTALRFAFHPGDAAGKALSVIIGNRTAGLVGRNPLVPVDLDVPDWQIVEIPLETLYVTGPVESISFKGNLEGTFYIDDLRLVGGEVQPATVVQEERTVSLPHAFALRQNFPNPFNSSTVICFSLPAAKEIELAVFNLAGQKVATLVNGWYHAGDYTVRWDGRDDSRNELASAVYLYRLRAGTQMVTCKLLLLQ